MRMALLRISSVRPPVKVSSGTVPLTALIIYEIVSPTMPACSQMAAASCDGT